MKLIEALLQVPVAEESGARTASRFKYEQHWALSEILARHAEDSDYLFIFEYHDDVLVLDSVTSPTSAAFYQVKTKSGASWKIEKLLERKNGEKAIKSSYLGKLFKHKLDFKDFNITLGFVTNAYFDFVKESEKTRIEAIDLEQKVKAKITKAIDSELPPLSPAPLNALCFVRSPISIDGQEVHLKGLLVDFLNKFVGTSDAVDVGAWYQSLMAEVSRKTNIMPTEVKVSNDLVSLKGFSRDDMLGFIGQVKNLNTTTDKWQVLQALLLSEKIDGLRLMGIQSSWNEVRLNLLSSSNLAFIELYEDIRTRVRDSIAFSPMVPFY